MGTTTKWNLPYPEQSDPNDVPTHLQALADRLDLRFAEELQGVLADRPAAGRAGRSYWATDAGYYRDDGSIWQEVTGDPPGSLRLSAASGSTVGWLLCNGAEYDRVAYSRLYNAIGTSWGTPTNGSVFKVPDFRDRFLCGSGTTRPLADEGGSDQLTIALGNLPAHHHSGPSHGHDFPGGSGYQYVIASAHVENNQIGTTGQAGNVNVTFSNSPLAGTGNTGDTGSGNPLTHVPKYGAVVVLIRA